MKEYEGLIHEPKYRSFLPNEKNNFWICSDCKGHFRKSEMIFSGLEGACEECWTERSKCGEAVE